MGALGGGRRLLRSGLLPLCGVLLLAGCASMPSSGEVRKVGDTQHADSDTQVRVGAIPPSPDETPSAIVSGFMEATTSSEADFTTARKYLAKGVQWNPGAKITVFSGQAVSHETGGSAKGGEAMVDLSATKAAVVDTKHAYEPSQGPFDTEFHLIRQDNQWRIDGLPGGLVLSDSDFQRIYHSVNMYYFARLGPDGHGSDGPVQALVADPVYLRNQTDPLVATVSALLGGPTTWLAPVVSSAAPTGAALDSKASDGGVTVDDSQRLRVRLDRAADGLRGTRCTMFAAQLFATVQAQASAPLSSVELLRADGSTACRLPGQQAAQYGSDKLVGRDARPYYIEADGDHRLLALPEDDADSEPRATPVSGPFGAAKAGLGSVAIRRDQQAAAGVRDDGHDLVVGSLVGGTGFGKALVHSRAAGGLSAPSWDGFDDLWVADRDPDSPRLLVLSGGMGTPVEVPVPGLEGRVESLRVASDGVRIALVVQDHGTTRLQLGRIVRAGSTQHPAFSVDDLRPLSPVGESVTSVSWAGPSRLVVLDAERGGAQRIEYVNTDGSAASALQGVSEAASVSASENPKLPLLASYAGRVYQLPADANWKQLSPKGVSPVYPG
ncbi:LpqB family beta-propeller domain-containing protein [Actinacidiphila yeochonensis]|uniref:LpqB family beta-propeller domain-containing protein n=1 Tax=Actinacidiphila yeochonensis TaxID=89050 RepID=UPI00055C1E13|nr:LpqB family beta-propeller domain-containing protein [Actinacidiphila yeochonensis]